jgi:hypothetical protein
VSQQRLIIYPCSGGGKTTFQQTTVTTDSGGGTSSVKCGGSYGGQILYGNLCYYWSEAFQNNNGNFTANGASVTMSQVNPKVTEKVDPTGKAYGSHSIMEMWVSTKDSKQVAEIGWFKDNGMTSPTLFVTYWVNGNVLGYLANNTTSGPGYVQVSSTVKPGNKIPLGGTGNYMVKIANNQLQYYWNGVEFGYVPLSIWTSRGVSFPSIQYAAVYGEVVNGYITQPSTVQMGNGIMGNASGSAAFSNYKLYGSTVPAQFTGFVSPSGDAASHYSIGHETSTSFTVGGPGY